VRLEKASHVFDLCVGGNVLCIVGEIFENDLRDKRVDSFLLMASMMVVTLTVLSLIGGSTMVFSMVLITIFHNSLSKRLRTVFSQDCAYIVREPSSKSISGLKTSSASVEPALVAPLPLIANSRSPNSRTL